MKDDEKQRGRPLNVYLRMDQLEWLGEHANAEDRSISYIVRQLIDDGMQATGRSRASVIMKGRAR